MTYRNRVDPFGELHATPARGTLMGNRGILHDESGAIRRSHAHPNWVACALSFKDRKREIMQPGNYTELFFLDEATALAAGHRPCATCRRERYRAFTEAWRRVHGDAPEGWSLPQTIDKALHAARIDRKRRKVTFEAEAECLPDGTVFAVGEEAVLLWQGREFAWGFEGYRPCAGRTDGDVAVLTPAPVVDVLREGYLPAVHPSVG
ncbi:hypothetical protein [Salipiger mucosus]|uniref:Ada DNA repair metal-binding domain-containing protein n=1 Tax=Salipiger mucosus DSM 16094 TaxID=1123237 RepID=S9S692_9RHOB|nr:hypothetical protein [Salipiger mucosus]EPX85710.1 hypothetical protein Salmuc_04982 [Salipiger mucosus DSM 16094]